MTKDNRSYRVGHEYRDTGSKKGMSDQFLSWINVKGSGLKLVAGIRPLRYLSAIDSEGLPAFLFLITHEKSHGPQNPWEDQIDLNAARIMYWGDAKFDQKKRYTDFSGNKVLKRIFEYMMKDERECVPPILHFSKARAGYVRFNGVCALSKLELSWFDDHGHPSPNYRAYLDILDIAEVSISWLHDRRKIQKRCLLNKNAPAAWRDYCKGNLRKMDIYKQEIRTRKHQLPEDGSQDDDVLSELLDLTARDFEKVVVALFQKTEVVAHRITLTSAVRDGGFDFLGEFVLPSPFNYSIRFRGEVKRYAQSNGVTPDLVSRLVARLLRGEYGLFITTSY